MKESARISEGVGNHRITVVYGKHVSWQDSAWNLYSNWSKKTQEIVRSLSPGPTIVIPDGLVSGWYFDDLARFAPTEDINHFGPAGSTVHLVGSDIFWKGQLSFLPKEIQSRWHKILDAAAAVDPTIAASDMNLAYGWANAKNVLIESGLVLVPIYGAYKAVDVIEKHPKQTRNELYDASRRAFMKRVTLGTIGLMLIKSGVHFGATRVTEGIDSESKLMQLVQQTKPIFSDSLFLRLRIAKYGLTSLDMFEQHIYGAHAVIANGSDHKGEIFPGQKAGESRDDAKKRLLISFAQDANQIIQAIKSEVSMSNRELADMLKIWLGGYSVYSAPQYPVGKSGPKFLDKHIYRTIPVLSELIDRLVSLPVSR